MVEGAPGFEHTFLKRALAADLGLDVDSVVRKGQNDDGRDTFFVQAGESRAAALSGGYPVTREALFQYDAIIFGNVEADFFTRDQLDLTARFVAERGGGLLVLGARSFERQGLTGTPLEEVLPVDLTDRRATMPRPVTEAAAGGEGAVVNAPSVTPDGAAHPATRLTGTVDNSRKLWRQLPALASVALVGGPRPGAQVLAVTASPGGEAHPLIAVQRYGQGRTMIFAGEASWRWRMMRPASDTTYDTIWRQLVRWLATAAPGQVSVTPMAVAVPGGTELVSVIAKDARFGAVADAEVIITLDVARRPGPHADAVTGRSQGRPICRGRAVRSAGRLQGGCRGAARRSATGHRHPLCAGRRRRSRDERSAPERSRAATRGGRQRRPISEIGRGGAAEGRSSRMPGPTRPSPNCGISGTTSGPCSLSWDCWHSNGWRGAESGSPEPPCDDQQRRPRYEPAAVVTTEARAQVGRRLAPGRPVRRAFAVCPAHGHGRDAVGDHRVGRLRRRKVRRADEAMARRPCRPRWSIATGSTRRTCGCWWTRP